VFEGFGKKGRRGKENPPLSKLKRARKRNDSYFEG
jgi:hypothetical protein